MAAAPQALREALKVLGKDRFVCAVHDRSLPSSPGEDVGCGTPGSEGAEGFLDFLVAHGFTGVQLGPAGRIAAGNLSPYDGTAFSRSELLVPWRLLQDGSLGAELLPRSVAKALWTEPEGKANHCDYRRAFALQREVLQAVHARWEAGAGAPLEAKVTAFVQASGSWLEKDALHDALTVAYRHPDPSTWPKDVAELFVRGAGAAQAKRFDELKALHVEHLRRYERTQWLVHAVHAAFRRQAQARGLKLYGDLQVGLSHADRWARAGLFLDGYAVGAPPSRTNPDGQPWAYPVLDPALLRAGPGLAFVEARLENHFAEYDGVRLDHPHGLVCPWVYRTDAFDQLEAVQTGARLYSVGAAPKHASLAGFDIARPEQLDTTVDPWADEQVRSLDDAQVAAYARQLDAVVQKAKAAGRDVHDIVCEVLSTMPYPLGRVLERHGLGRFRVTQKADVTKPDDVYLVHNASAADWVMVGTHDTAPLWLTAAGWGLKVRDARAAYAAQRLAPDGVGRAALEQAFQKSAEAQAAAELAVLFTSEARNVMVFVSDLLGEREVYNRPGVVHPDNWTVRVPHDYAQVYEARRKQGEAMDVGGALALALAARPAEERKGNRLLIESLAQDAMVGSAALLPLLTPRLA